MLVGSWQILLQNSFLGPKSARLSRMSDRKRNNESIAHACRFYRCAVRGLCRLLQHYRHAGTRACARALSFCSALNVPARAMSPKVVVAAMRATPRTLARLWAHFCTTARDRAPLTQLEGRGRPYMQHTGPTLARGRRAQRACSGCPKSTVKNPHRGIIRWSGGSGYFERVRR